MIFEKWHKHRRHHFVQPVQRHTLIGWAAWERQDRHVDQDVQTSNPCGSPLADDHFHLPFIQSETSWSLILQSGGHFLLPALPA